MTVRAGKITDTAEYDGTVLLTWTGITNADTGASVKYSTPRDKCVQVTGTFGGATITIEGSNDNVNFVTLNDISAVALSFAATGLKMLLEAPLYVRVGRAGGDGTTSITVTISGVKARA